jgi:hypothetical protein
MLDKLYIYWKNVVYLTASMIVNIICLLYWDGNYNVKYSDLAKKSLVNSYKLRHLYIGMNKCDVICEIGWPDYSAYRKNEGKIIFYYQIWEDSHSSAFIEFDRNLQVSKVQFPK